MVRPAFSSMARMVCLAGVITSLGLSATKTLLAPITYDEAYSYLFFARQSYPGILSDYTFTNNHIVHTILLRASTELFGNGLVVLRLPAFAGLVALLAAFWRLARRLGPAGYLWTAAVALTPTVVNYGALARGYTLGSAFCAWAMVLLAGLLEPPEGRRRDWARLAGAGILLGAAIGCVPVFAVPALGIFLGYLVVSSQDDPRGRLTAITSRSMVAGVSVLAPVAFIYWRIRFDPRHWNFGYTRLTDFVRSFWENAYDAARMNPIDAGILSALMVFAAAGGLILAYRRRERAAAFVLAAFLASVFALTASRVILSTSWPFARNMLFLVPLVLFGPLYIMTAPRFRHRRSAMMVAPALVMVSGVIAATRFDPMVHREWRSNAGVPAVLARVVTDHEPGTPATVSIPWQLDPCVQYDLLRRGDQAIQVVEVNPEFQVWLARPEGDAAREPVLLADRRSGLVLTRGMGGEPADANR